ncbi:MAG: hypothetical protein QG571_1863, partial [Pseudomonadota bacterium]|nr:hypothetical protein [Pseudomonadota bacterium]
MTGIGESAADVHNSHMTRRGRILGVVVAGLVLAVLGLGVVLGYDSP